jgi:hypothetical protein
MSEGAFSAVSAHTTMIPNSKNEVNQNPPATKILEMGKPCGLEDLDFGEISSAAAINF